MDIVKRGNRFSVGSTPDAYAVQDLNTDSTVASFPRTDDGWTSAWGAFTQLEEEPPTEANVDSELVLRRWPDILAKVEAERRRLHKALKNAVSSRVEGDVLTIEFRSGLTGPDYAKIVESQAAFVREALRQVLGASLAVRTEMHGPSPQGVSGVTKARASSAAMEECPSCGWKNAPGRPCMNATCDRSVPWRYTLPVNAPARPRPRCPVCGSTGVLKTSVVGRLALGAAFGLLAVRPLMTGHRCANCGHKF